jgi:hypothetical protein
LVDVDAIAGYTEGFQTVALGREVLVVRGNPGVADPEFTHSPSVTG